MQVSHVDVLEVISDSICPWCYIGKRRLEEALRLVGETAPPVVWKPFQLNPAMPVEGMDRRAYRSHRFGSWERSQELDAQVRAAGAEAGLTFAHERMARTPNTLASHKLILFATEAGRGDAVVEGIFHAYFVEGRDIGEPEALADIGIAAGLPRADILCALEDEELARLVAEEEKRSHRLALHGVPTFVLGGHPLTSGAQPSGALAGLIRERQQTPAGAGATCGLEGDGA